MPSWKTIKFAALALITLGVSVWFNRYGASKKEEGKQERDAENNEQELKAHKRKEKRNDEIEDTNRALPRRKLFSKLRKQANKNGN